jgi:hypothetical protein
LLVLETELAAGILTVPDVEPKPKNVPIVGVVDNLRKVKEGVLEVVGKPFPPKIVEVV